MNNNETEATPSTSVRNVANSDVDNEESEVTSSGLLADQVELNASNEETKAVLNTFEFVNNEEREATSSNVDEAPVSTISSDQSRPNAVDEENPNILTSLSSTNRCSICLKKMLEMKLAGLECCDHTFHIECLSEWARINETCPLDRKTFSKVNIMTKSIPETSLRMGMALNYNTAEFRKATEEFQEQLKFLSEFEFSTRRQSKTSEESSSAPSK